MSSICGVCSDNFIVNSKLIKCSACTRDFHTKCVQVKDSALKVFSEYENFFFYCGECLGGVKAKLNSKPGESENVRPDNDFFEALIEKHTRRLMDDFQIKFNVLKNEVTTLKDSNKDLVRLLSSDEFRNPELQRSKGIPNTETKHPPPINRKPKSKTGVEKRDAGQPGPSEKLRVVDSAQDAGRSGQSEKFRVVNSA